MERARRELDKEIAMYGTIGNPDAARTRALFSRHRRKNPARAKEKPAFAPQRKRVVA